jgi:sporulation protein YhbH
MSTIFRPYQTSDAERSDRSARDRLRHRKKVRQAIQNNIADIIADESIIGQDRNRVVKVPLKGVKEYRFVYGENNPGVAQGNGDTRPGQVLGRARGQPQVPGEQAGSEPGQDYYETDVTLEELIGIMFDDLELPDMERKRLREVEAERLSKFKGHRSVGIRARLDKRRTARAKQRRKVASRKAGRDTTRFPFHQDDLTYRYVTTDTRPQSNAVVLCIMDTSGSMDTVKKYLARSFFFLLYQFINTRYQKVEAVFIAHHTQAKEVSEKTFFHKGESGGTFISSGYESALDIVHQRYHPALWNVYAFHCSDGDNFSSDNERAMRAARGLCEVCNLFGFAEIKPHSTYVSDGSFSSQLERLDADNFHAVLIKGKEDIWPSFKALLAKEQA